MGFPPKEIAQKAAHSDCQVPMSNIIAIVERPARDGLWLTKGSLALMTDPAADLLTTATLHAREPWPDAFHMTWNGPT